MVSNAVRRTAGWLQRLASRSNLAVGLSLQIRNQANAIIAYRLGETADASRNGEYRLARALAPHCHLFVDVGANVGLWSEYFLAHAPASCRGVAFEPGAEAYLRLQDRMRRYGRADVRRQVVSDREGWVTFREEPGAGEASCVVQGQDDGYHSTRVASTTLDREFPEQTVDYLKIDCEGHDLHVLRGAIRLLGDQRIRFLQFEYNSSWALSGSTLHSALHILRNSGYLTYLIHSDGLREFNYARYGEFYRYSNFFAVTATQLPAVAGLVGAPI